MKEPLQVLFDSALKLLSDKHCTEYELRKQLAKKFTHLEQLEKQIEDTIHRLRELHLINDSRLAEIVAQRYNHKGNRFIYQKLKRKGIGDDIIAKTLAILDKESERAIEVLRKSNYSEGTISNKPTKWLRFLYNRGFSLKAIDEAASDLQAELIPQKSSIR